MSKGKAREEKKIILACVEGDLAVYPEQILYVDSGGRRNCIHLKDKTYHIYRRLDDLEELLQEYDFVRTHRCNLVNLHHVECLSPTDVVMDNGEGLLVSKSRYKTVREAYHQVAGEDV